MEIWDLYDKNRNKLNKTIERGKKLTDDEYHLVVNAWIRNDKNEFLISQRSANKAHPLMWETTGGSAIAGEESIDAAIREVKEELDVAISKDTGKFLGTTLRYYPNCPDILDVWLFTSNAKIEQVKYQKEEVCNAMWASPEKIRKLCKEGKFEANAYLEEALTYFEKNK